MMRDRTSRPAGKVERHTAFWACERVHAPLIGVVVGGWSAFLENRGAEAVWGDGYLVPGMLKPEAFVGDCREALERYDKLDDDLFHTAQPFPAVPWLEAITGCPVRRSRHHLWAEPLPDALDHPEEIEYGPANPWVRKYLEFLEVFTEHLSPEHAVAQSIVRGPADVACALLGETRMVLNLNDTPEKMRRLLNRLTCLAGAFLRQQAAHIPPFCDGSVIGQYEIWTPGWALRLQEDAVGLLSPKLYREFVAPLDARLARMSAYNMFHTHTTSLHVLPELLRVPGLGAVEISRDEGVHNMAVIMPACKRVQDAARPLVIKGRFSENDLSQLRRELKPEGLCLQAVAETWAEGEAMLRFMRSLW